MSMVGDQVPPGIPSQTPWRRAFDNARTPYDARVALGLVGNWLPDFFYGGQFPMINGTFVVSVAASALTVALKTKAGADPGSFDVVKVVFRNPTGTTGDYTVLPVTSATSVTAASGSTYGLTNATACRLWIVGFNDSGTFRLGLTNNLTGAGLNANYAIASLNDNTLRSSTQDSGAASSAGVIYTTGAAVTTKPMRILGFLEWNSSGIAAVGTWTTTNLSTIQLFGPGVCPPGFPVQRKFAKMTTTSTTTSATFVSTGATISITPSAAANLLRITACGILVNQSGGTSIGAAFAQLSRGTTNNTNMMGNVAKSETGFLNDIGAATAALVGFDVPNTASSQTYAAQLRNATAGDTASYGQGAGDTMEITEYMV